MEEFFVVDEMANEQNGLVQKKLDKA